MKNKILWLTADYFIDVDLPIVPELKSKFEIDWYILKGYRSNVEVPLDTCYKIVEMPFRGKDPRLIKFYYSLFKMFGKNQYNIIYIDLVGFPFFHPILNFFYKNSDIKIVHAAHNVIPYDGWPDRKLLTIYVNYIFNKFNNIHIFSSFLLDYFKTKYPNSNCLYAPLSLKNYGCQKTDVYKLDSKKCNFLFFGNIKKNKNLELLIKVFKNLPSKFKSKIHLTIAGSCEDSNYYIELISNSENITYHFRRILDEEVPELFSNSNFLVLPYNNVAQSGPHMIAYNYNLPVIASNINGFKERIIDGENGFLFESNDFKSLYNSLIRAIELNNEEYQIMKYNLSKFVEKNYSSKSILPKYIDFFNSL